ncbi:hypothetical protein OBBRIDRAFT_795741 [Obba rivulosa]|uniref:Uncharacterized protein n=1 Tax=Obba rivulosa TaxID=1052685 RepID=A0A8E2AT62_9APHY|nr:hypothetical protein OBBRIDRAFT_795741 [Obba rivulosa]
MVSVFPPPGPGLPAFRSLLIYGPYHPSAPVHLILSSLAQEPTSKSILISSSRSSLKTALVEHNDNWISMHGSSGKVSGCASRCEILYPPSTAHLVTLLSMLHEYGGTYYHWKTTLDVAPSLMVLHEPSALLPNTSTVSTYLSLITHTMSAVQSLAAQSSTRIALAVFDSGLHELKLPIVRLPNQEAAPGDASDATGRTESVVRLVEGYFEWVGHVEEHILELMPTQSPPYETPLVQRELSLWRTRYAEDPEFVWKWSEGMGEARETVFQFL